VFSLLIAILVFAFGAYHAHLRLHGLPTADDDAPPIRSPFTTYDNGAGPPRPSIVPSPAAAVATVSCQPPMRRMCPHSAAAYRARTTTVSITRSGTVKWYAVAVGRSPCYWLLWCSTQELSSSLSSGGLARRGTSSTCACPIVRCRGPSCDLAARCSSNRIDRASGWRPPRSSLSYSR
jgi:hypothetical protein